MNTELDPIRVGVFVGLGAFFLDLMFSSCTKLTSKYRFKRSIVHSVIVGLIFGRIGYLRFIDPECNLGIATGLGVCMIGTNMLLDE